MWLRRTGGLTLALLLLGTALADVAGHDHAAGREHAAVACEIDHGGASRADASSSSPNLAAAGERHEHRCLGCRFGGLRLTLAPPAIAPVPALEPETPVVPRARLRVARAWTGRTNRGPPAA